MPHHRIRTPGHLALAIAAALLAASCASGPGSQADFGEGSSRSTGRAGQDHAGQQPTSPAAHSTAPADVTVKAAVTDGQVSPPPHRVKVEQGETVRLVVTSDDPDRVHVHGYDLERQVTPSQPAVITFTADQVGVFEVETHQSGLQLLQLQIR